MNNLIKSASRIVSKAAYFGVAWAVLTALMSETGLQTASATGGSLKLIATIDVGVLPGDIAVTPDGKYLYIANYESDTVSVIDTSLKTVSSTIALPSVLGPTNIVITADGTTAFVLAGSGNIRHLDRNKPNSQYHSGPGEHRAEPDELCAEFLYRHCRHVRRHPAVCIQL